MRYKWILVFLFISVALSAETLKDLLLYTKTHNENILAQSFQVEVKSHEIQGLRNSYYPTVDVGGFYQRDDKANPILPGSIYSMYAKVSVNIYKGGEKKYTLKQKKNEFYASQYKHTALTKETQLSIVKDFYAIVSKKAKKRAIIETLKAIQAQKERVKSFFDVKLSTEDEVQRLQSTYDKTRYSLEALKFQILSLQKRLDLQVGKKITSLEESTFIKVDLLKKNELEQILSLVATKKSLKNAVQIVGSYLLPHIKIEDTYSFYAYQDLPSLAGFSIDQVYNQNRILATLNMRIFDFSTIDEKKNALLLQVHALEKKISYKQKEQKMQEELALERIKTSKLQILSAKSAKVASFTALQSITQKYKMQLVNYIVYLDALSADAQAKAIYEEARYNLELSYALYYYYNGKKLEEFLDE